MYSRSSKAPAAQVTSLLPGLEQLWEKTLGDPDVRIALIDGPVDLSHQCFRGARIEQTSLPAVSTPDGLSMRHGTQVASILFGQPGSSVQGVAPGCTGIILPVFHDRADGQIGPCSQVDLARAIDLAVQHRACIINISAGQLQASEVMHPLLDAAVRNCKQSGVMIIAAVGNDGSECIHVPAAAPSVLAVGAMNQDGNPLEWSNWGPHYKRQGILAPGSGISCAGPEQSVIVSSGTSLATALVSGIAGLLLSLQRKSTSGFDPATVRDAIVDTAIGCRELPAMDCERLLAGRLDLARAISFLLEGMDDMSEPNEMIAGADPVLFSQSGASHSALSAGVMPSGCGCSGAVALPQIVYALGQIGYDYGTEARRDSIEQHMGAGANPHDARHLLAYLEKNPWDAAEITWTLALDHTQVYAISPTGSFAPEAFTRLRTSLAEQLAGKVERVSIPGRIVGKTTLVSGQTLAVIDPVLRGMYSWHIDALVHAACGDPPVDPATDSEHSAYQQKARGVGNFLRRVYGELRNLGITSHDRALNYAATNAMLVAKVFHEAAVKGMELDAIFVEPSPIGRPGSDSWDVKLKFFDPRNVLTGAGQIYAFTVDVIDSVPLMVGELRSWFAR
jgi:hypothetical protein